MRLTASIGLLPALLACAGMVVLLTPGAALAARSDRFADEGGALAAWDADAEGGPDPTDEAAASTAAAPDQAEAEPSTTDELLERARVRTRVRVQLQQERQEAVQQEKGTVSVGKYPWYTVDGIRARYAAARQRLENTGVFCARPCLPCVCLPVCWRRVRMSAVPRGDLRHAGCSAELRPEASLAT